MIYKILLYSYYLRIIQIIIVIPTQFVSFSNVFILQGSVAAYLRCAGKFCIHFLAMKIYQCTAYIDYFMLLKAKPTGNIFL